MTQPKPQTKFPKQSAEHKKQQSILTKVERSEKDVISSINWTLGALFLMQFVTFLMVFISL
jgi:hypothetical protein